jgi:hypothetical protein
MATTTRETPNAKRAWADYLAMGPERSLEALARRYRIVIENGGQAPTTRLPTLADWSRHFGWQARLSEIADRETREAEEREAAYRRSVLEDGYALSHKRVEGLKVLAGLLYDELTAEGEDNRRWLDDVKQIGSGADAVRVPILRFNASEVEQLRGLLEDIAKEVGGRAQKLEHSGPGGGPIPIHTIIVDMPGETEQVQ